MAKGGRPVGPGLPGAERESIPEVIMRHAALPAAVRTLGAPPRSAWPTEGLPCHNTGGGAPEGGVPRAGPVFCCRWQ